MLESADLTNLLQSWSRGDSVALERLIPLIFADLRRMARSHLRGERSGHTLQPTALVNEVCVKLLEQRAPDWQNREQFFAVAAQMMRRILWDYGKARQTEKRGKDVVKVPLDAAFELGTEKNPDLAALEEALSTLGKIDPRQARIVELRYLFGFEHEEIAEILKVSATTSKREWRVAKMWLFRELTR